MVAEDSAIMWLVFTYMSNSLDILILKDQGLESQGYLSLLEDNNICFILHRIDHVSSEFRSISSTSTTKLSKAHYGLIHWVGKKVGLLEKALAPHHFSTFENMMKNKMQEMNASISGGHLHADSKDDLSLGNLKNFL